MHAIAFQYNALQVVDLVMSMLANVGNRNINVGDDIVGGDSIALVCNRHQTGLNMLNCEDENIRD